MELITLRYSRSKSRVFYLPTIFQGHTWAYLAVHHRQNSFAVGEKVVVRCHILSGHKAVSFTQL